MLGEHEINRRLSQTNNDIVLDADEPSF